MRNERIYLSEVAPRDGLQMEKQFVATDDKVEFIDALSRCGFARIEVTSFVSAKAVPAMADAEAVMHRIVRAPGVTYAALVPNLRGLERALDCGPDELSFVMSCSEAHNQANLRMSREASLQQLKTMLGVCAASGVIGTVALSTAFGCPFEGAVSEHEVQRLATELLAAGAQGVTLCDTTGMADARRSEAVIARVLREAPAERLTAHFHDTHGQALANARAALELGITRFDGSCAGLGGCPFAPGAPGNVSSEALVRLFESLDQRTGVDIDRLHAVAQRVPAWIGRAPA